MERSTLSPVVMGVHVLIISFFLMTIYSTSNAQQVPRDPHLPQACHDLCRSEYPIPNITQQSWTSGFSIGSKCNLRCGGLTDFSFLKHMDPIQNFRQYLHFYNNSVPVLQTDLFNNRAFSEVNTLGMVNSGIQRIEPGALQGLNLTLFVLDLDFNEISKINNETFAALSQLYSLSLSENKISSIGDGSFHELLKLKYISLSKNKIVVLRNNMFEGAYNLVSLGLDHNQITTIEPNAFSGLSVLRHISLDNNYISNLAPETFIGCTILKNLHLKNNRLQRIDSQIFERNVQLGNLDLANNNFSNINSLNLNSSSLLSIYLVNVSIDYLPPNIFDNLRNLRYLDLSKNNLSKLETGLFANLTKLIGLKLNSNNLSVISVATLSEILPVLQNRRMRIWYNSPFSNNPWDCQHDEMRTTLDWCREKNITINIDCDTTLIESSLSNDEEI